MARKIGRYIIFFLCSILILFILVTLVLPSTGKIVKEAFIPARRLVVLSQLTALHNYASWYPWIQIDPTAKVSFWKNKQGLSWNGTENKSGNGTYEITSVGGDSILHFRFTYNTVPPITGAYLLRPSEDGKGTNVIWYMTMKAGWTPWWRFYAAMMNKLTAPVMEAGLTNLKILSKEADDYADIPIKDSVIHKTLLVTINDTILQNALYPTLSNLFSLLGDFIGSHHLTQNGMPMAQLQVLNDYNLRIRAGIPVHERFASTSKVKLLVLPTENVLKANFQGNYKDLQRTYKALSHNSLRYSQNASNIPWEIYIDGVIPETDTSYCNITIYYPVHK